MTPASPAAPPAAPPASGPQEATPAGALAAEFEEDAHQIAQQGSSPFTEVAHSLRTCAEDVRQRLAPAWDALAAGNERLRTELSALAASWTEPIRMATATHDEIIEQYQREECARGLLAILGEAPGA